MARISNYKQDTELTASDRLVGSSYEGDGQTGPVYKTRTYTLGELNSYFSTSVGDNTAIAENEQAIAQARVDIDAVVDSLSAVAHFLVDISSSYNSYDSNGGNITSVSTAFANLIIQTTTSDRFATSQYVLDLFSSIADVDENGNVTSVSSSLIQQIIETLATGTFASATFTTNLASSFGTYDNDPESPTYGRITAISESFANSILSTFNTDGFATASDLTTLRSAIFNVNQSGEITTVSEAFASSLLQTTAMDDKAEASYVTLLEAGIGDLDDDPTSPTYGEFTTINTTFINEVAAQVNVSGFATTQDLTRLESSIGTIDPNTLEMTQIVESFAENLLLTTAQSTGDTIVASAQDVRTLGSYIVDKDAQGTITNIASSFATDMFQTSASDVKADTTYVQGLFSYLLDLDVNGQFTGYSSAFATQVLNTVATQNYASTSYVDTIIAAIGDYDDVNQEFTTFEAQFISDVSASVNTSGFAIATEVEAQFSQVANFDDDPTSPTYGDFQSFSTAAQSVITSTIASENQSEADYVNSLTAVVGATRTGDTAELDPSLIQAEATVDAANTSTTPNSIVDGAVEGSKIITLSAANNDIKLGQYVEIDSVPGGVPYMADQYSRVESILSPTSISVTVGMYIPDGSTIRFIGDNTVDVTVSTGTIRPGFYIRSLSDTHTDVKGTIVLANNNGTLTLNKAEAFTQAEALEFLGVYATVEETASVLANLDGTLRSSYGLQVDANGNVAGMRFLADNVGSEIVFNTDSFKVVNSDTGTTSVAPFEIVTGGDNPGLYLNIPLNGVSGSFAGDISAASGTFGGISIDNTGVSGGGLTLDTNGLVGGGVTINSAGVSSAQFAINAVTGDATFTGNITGASGTFGGASINSSGIAGGGIAIDSTGFAGGGVTINSQGLSSSQFNIDAVTGNATFSGTLQIGAGQNQITIDDTGLSVASNEFEINSDGNAIFRGVVDVEGITINGTELAVGGGKNLVWYDSDDRKVAEIRGEYLDNLPSLRLLANDRIYIETDILYTNQTGKWYVDGVDADWFFSDDFNISSSASAATSYKIDGFRTNNISAKTKGTSEGTITLETKPELSNTANNQILLVENSANTYTASTAHVFNLLNDTANYRFYYGGTNKGAFTIGDANEYPTIFETFSNKYVLNFEGLQEVEGFKVRSTAGNIIFSISNTGNTVTEYLQVNEDATVLGTANVSSLNLSAWDGINPSISIDKNASNVRLIVIGDDAFGYGVTNVYQYGSYTATGTISAPTISQTSDISLKENIVDLNKSINASWKQFNMKDSPDQIRYGVIAQELEVEHPEFVSENEGIKSVNYIDLLVAKVAELENRIKELESKQNI